MVVVATIKHINSDIGYVACLLDKDNKNIEGTMRTKKHAHQSNVSAEVARSHRLQLVQVIISIMEAMETKAAVAQEKKVEFSEDVKVFTVPRQEKKRVAFSNKEKIFIVPRKEWTSKSQCLKEWAECGVCLRQKGLCNPITPEDMLEESRLEKIWGDRRCLVGCFC